jgi:Fe2+ or Zn2+ uptake regulation protein
MNKKEFFFEIIFVNKKEEEISEQILKYLQKNPDSGDTLEGIVKFWLKCERIDQSVDDVRDALEGLVERGVVIRLKTKGNMPIYKVARKT